MTTTTEVREAFTTISTILADAITAARERGASGAGDPFATLVAHVDQVRGFVNDMATTIGDVEPDLDARVRPTLQCSACIQDERNAEATGQTPRPILPAATIVNGLALCDVIGRHRIVTATQAAVAQANAIWKPGDPLPGQNGQQRPGGMLG